VNVRLAAEMEHGRRTFEPKDLRRRVARPTAEAAEVRVVSAKQAPTPPLLSRHATRTRHPRRVAI
jgi:hypothetical protein